MKLNKGVGDFHLHTKASDGTSTLKERVKQANESGLKVIGITDHDRIHPKLEHPSTKINDVEVITGVEAKADFNGTKIEILGYYINPQSTELRNLLGESRDKREKRNREMIKNFREVTGIDVTYKHLMETTNGYIGRPHLAYILIQKGYVHSISEAFDEYLDEDGDIYVPVEKPTHHEVISGIKSAGGITSLAHPCRIDSRDLKGMLRELKDDGLQGMEVIYPYDIEASPDRKIEKSLEELSEIAEELAFLKTGGSDCHGDGSGKFHIGRVAIPGDWIDSLRDKATTIKT